MAFFLVFFISLALGNYGRKENIEHALERKKKQTTIGSRGHESRAICMHESWSLRAQPPTSRPLAPAHSRPDPPKM